MIRTLSANTVEDALNQIREQFSSDVTIISILDTNQGVSVRFNTQESYIVREVLEKIEEFLIQHQMSAHIRDEILTNVNQGQYGYEANPDVLIGRIFSLDPLYLQKHDKRNPLILVGFPGVGKTNLAMKYAYYIKKSGGHAHVISCDVLKSGGVEEVRTLGKKSGIPVSIAITPDDAWVMAQNIKNDSVVIIDTPGIQVRDQLPLQCVRELSQLFSGHMLWVERSGYDCLDYQLHHKILHAVSIGGIAVTQSDISEKISGLLEFSYQNRIPLRSFTGGSFACADEQGLAEPVLGVA